MTLKSVKISKLNKHKCLNTQIWLMKMKKLLNMVDHLRYKKLEISYNNTNKKN